MDATEVEKLVEDFRQSDLNEADTRHQFIDVLIHEVLGWPRTRVSCESKVHSGYIDYEFRARNEDTFFVLEAKRQGTYFETPTRPTPKSRLRQVSVSSLLTDDSVNAAIQQVRSYANDLGCEFAGITNGDQWILFRPFARGKRWTSLKALVIQDSAYFYEKYTEFVNLLGFTAVTKNASLSNALKLGSGLTREVYYPKSEIDHFDAEVAHNDYAKYLRPITNRFFRNLEDAETEDFFERCYVQERAQAKAYKGMSEIIRDALTPYFEQYNIEDTDDNARGGKFGNRIVKSIRETKSNDVVVLFGGKGIGKSTFIRRLLIHQPPQFLDKHAVVVRVDLLSEPDNVEGLHAFTWNRAIDELDQDKVLDSDQESILDLFSNRFEVWERQFLPGLDGSDRAKEISRFIAECKADQPYCAKALKAYWDNKHKGVVIVIDNTDQFERETQDYCFQLAQKMSSTLGCLALISMREERFHQSRIHGVLDAYQNSGYHLSTPLPDSVFLKRIQYVLSVLDDEQRLAAYVPHLHPDSDECADLEKFFKILGNEFRKGPESPLFMFLVSCAHGNIRLALELFREFVKSGYTNVKEMVSVQGLWTLKIHQVVRPLLAPGRFFYEEKDSTIPNILQIRAKSKSSHFTSIRLLKRLAAGADPNNPHFMSLVELSEIFVSQYDLRDEFYESVDLLLRYGLIESTTKSEEIGPDMGEIRVTQYGLYLINSILHQFPYLDLVCTDCGVMSESASHEIADLANRDYLAFKRNDIGKRIEVRIEKVSAFLRYLAEQESWERENYGIVDEDLVAEDIKSRFDKNVEAIRSSAKRNIKRKEERQS